MGQLKMGLAPEKGRVSGPQSSWAVLGLGVGVREGLVEAVHARGGVSPLQAFGLSVRVVYGSTSFVAVDFDGGFFADEDGPAAVLAEERFRVLRRHRERSAASARSRPPAAMSRAKTSRAAAPSSQLGLMKQEPRATAAAIAVKCTSIVSEGLRPLLTPT